MRLISACALLILCVAGQIQYDVFESTITDLHASLLTNQVTCPALIQLFFDRIEAYDKQNVTLNSLITLNKNAALKRAHMLHASFDPKTAGMLYCIPVIAKDNYDVKGLPTTAGCLAMATSVPNTNAPVIDLLENAGAIIIAKANMAEFALDGMNTNSSMGGQTLNVYAPGYTPYGSSGGSATSVSATFSMISLGTDTDGSIMDPSSAQSLNGLRSTIHLINTEGIVPLSPAQDVSGPLARTVTDLAIAMNAMAPNATNPTVYTDALDPLGLVNANIGYVSEVLQTMNSPLLLRPSPYIVELGTRAVSAFQGAGANVSVAEIFEIVFTTLMPYQQAATECGNRMFKYALNAYLASLPANAPCHSIDDVLASGKYGAAAGEYLSMVNKQNTYPPSQDGNCTLDQIGRNKTRDAIVAFMDANKIDAFLLPYSNQPPMPLNETVPPNLPLGVFFTVFVSAYSGLPMFNFPVGYTDGPISLPVGFSLLGRPYSEAQLIKYAYAFEQYATKRIPPTIVPPLNPN